MASEAVPSHAAPPHGAPPHAPGAVPPARAATAPAWIGWAKVVAALALLIAAPHFLYPVYLANLLCFALFAAAFNLLLGFAGLLSFGHAAFFGFAAYVSAHSAKVWGLTPELGILLGTATSAALGLLIGLLAIRRQGIYFAMVTLALSQMVYFLCVQAGFTGGEDGIQGVPRGKLFGLINLGPNPAIYYFTLVIFVAGIAIIYRTVHSPFGQVLKSIRENEPRAISLGYDADRYKLLAFVLSATLAGLAGSTKVLVFQLASLTDVTWQMSGEVVLMTMLGGVGTMLGPIVGAGIIITMQNYLAHVGSLTTIIQGLVFIFCVLLFRRGIVGEINFRWRQLRSRGAKATTVSGAASRSAMPSHAEDGAAAAGTRDPALEQG